MKTLRILVLSFAIAMVTLACAHAGTPGLPSTDPPVLASERVNLNTATEYDLIELKGIGPAKAAAIVAYRKKHGAFAHIEDLNKVKGFGRKTIAKLRQSLTIDAPAAPPAKEAPTQKH